MLSKAEFDKRISQIPGVKDDGHGNWLGIRLLTPLEKKERESNAEKIRQAICMACGADERTCGSACLLMKNHIHKVIAAMVPCGIVLKASSETAPIRD